MRLFSSVNAEIQPIPMPISCFGRTTVPPLATMTSFVASIDPTVT